MINLSTGAFFERGTRQIGVLRARAESLQGQIGTGERLERSSDDPVAAARLRTLARSERLRDVDNRASDMAGANLSLTDQALGSIADIVTRVRELAVQASNATISADQRAAIGVEVEGLKANLFLLANGRDIAGHALFGGQTAGAAYVDAPPGATYIGTATLQGVEIGEGQSVVPGIVGTELFEFSAAGGPTDLFTVIGALGAALKTGDPAAAGLAQDSLSMLDAGLERVTTAQTVVGARLNWIDLMGERREAVAEQAASERADVGGADIAVAISRLQETLTVLEASQSSFVKLANLSLFSILR